MRPFKVVRIVRDEHWALFHDVLFDRQTTIESAHRWLTTLGYRITRTAVWNYMRALRRNRQGFIRVAGRGVARRQLRLAMEQLSTEAMASLASYAVFLASSAGSATAPRNGESKGVRSSSPARLAEVVAPR